MIIKPRKLRQLKNTALGSCLWLAIAGEVLRCASKHIQSRKLLFPGVTLFDPKVKRTAF